jgi:hypothetical protein
LPARVVRVDQVGRYETSAHRIRRGAALGLGPTHDWGATALAAALAQVRWGRLFREVFEPPR